MRLIKLNTVVLPAPLGPISVNTSPWRTSKLTRLTASTPPKPRLNCLAESKMLFIGAAAPGRPKLVAQSLRDLPEGTPPRGAAKYMGKRVGAAAGEGKTGG